MTPAPCPRLFEVEAARDGRLTGAELASFERHMTGCPACRQEAQALEALAETLRTCPRDARGEDMLHLRRERTRLLAAFDRALLTPEIHEAAVGPGAALGVRSGTRRTSGSSRGPGALFASVAVATLVAGILVRWRVWGGEPSVRATAVVHADSTAKWSERTDDKRETIVLDRGALWIHVDHASGEGRLLVVLPDGELEDTGTTFTVSAEEGRTTRVAVHEGSVVLRLRGQPPVALGGGDTWAPEARPAASACASGAPPVVATLSSTTLPPSSAPHHAASPSTPSITAPAPESSVDFRAAMAALDAGDNAGAAAAFAGFLAKHPHDPRAEDAAYLRVIALQRSGASESSGSVRSAAQEYLRRYPAGFRRAEMEALTR